MKTNYSAPVATLKQDTYVSLADWEELLMVWTLRSHKPERDGFTTISFAIQTDGSGKYVVVERVNGNCTSPVLDGFTQTQTFDNKDDALDYWGECVRGATPPCSQPALPGFVELVATFTETYYYRGGYGSGPCDQSHARVGDWS